MRKQTANITKTLWSSAKRLDCLNAKSRNDLKEHRAFTGSSTLYTTKPHEHARQMYMLSRYKSK